MGGKTAFKSLQEILSPTPSLSGTKSSETIAPRPNYWSVREWIENLSNDFSADKYLEDEPAFATRCHISEGGGKCTHIEAIFDDKKD